MTKTWKRDTRRLTIQGAIAGVAAGLAMDLFARAARSIGGGREAPGAAPGTHRDGRGAQPPQAKSRAEDDAAVRVGSAAYRLATGADPGRATRIRLGIATHYAFSAAAGVCYTLASDRYSALGTARGALYGSIVWIVADEMAMPAMSLSRGAADMTWGLLAYALCAHWVYGVTLDTVARVIRDQQPAHAKRVWSAAL